MSEVDLKTLGENSRDEEHKIPTAMQEVNAALKECGFGWFHIRLLLSAFVGYTCGVSMAMTTPYILPIAECDLNMNLVDKGVLNAIPYVGMIASSAIAGFLTDTFGRKKFLVYGFGGLFIFTVISGLSQKYSILVISKFFEGFIFAASFTPLMSLTSELCHSEIRDRVMLVQSSFVAVGQISVALVSWAILTRDWKDTLFGGYFVLKTWNYYLLIMSLWSFCACFLYMFIPESPKYYITQNKFDEARSILIQIYKTNTRKPAESFKYINLWMSKTKQGRNEYPDGEHKSQLSAGFENIKPLFQKPLILYLSLLCFINFFTMTQYNVLRLWFPQLSTIVENYRSNGTEDLCVMLDTYTRDLREKAKIAINEVCVPVSLAMGIIMTSGRTGTLVGNVMFPILLNLGCVVPFFTLAGLMLGITILALFLPTKKS